MQNFFFVGVIGLLLASCSPHTPNVALELSKNSFTCVLDLEKKANARGFQKIKPIRYEVKVLDDEGVHAQMRMGGKTTRLRYEARTGTRNGLKSTDSWSYRVKYRGRNATGLVFVEIPHRASSGKVTFFQFEGRRVSEFYQGTCV